MASTLLQDTAGSLVVYLETTAGAAATGLIFSDVTADLKKDGGSFTSHTLTGDNFTELGSGFYEIDLAAGDTDTLGNIYLRVFGSTIETALFSAFIAASAPTNPTTTSSPTTSLLFGFVYEPDGSPANGAVVSARILSSPAVLHSGTEGIGIATGLVSASSDSAGFFSLDLIAGSTVDFFIPSMNYRRTLIVPSSSKNVFDIP